MSNHIHNVYPVKTQKRIHPSDPLHVGHFYGKQRNHISMMDERQALILYLARMHQLAIDSGMPRGFCRIPISLTRLRKWVYDYRVALDYFFTVEQTGFRISNDNKELSIIVPKDLGTQKDPEEIMRAIIEKNLEYAVPPIPTEGVVSKVFIQFENGEYIREKLKEHKRFDLWAPVEFLLNYPSPEINFWFKPSGKLQLRDTSVWPIHGIETWPSWLREALFGTGIDIESAYTQYLLNIIRTSEGGERRCELMFPELIQSFENKSQWREDLCIKLGIFPDDEGIHAIKKICMSLANGGKISGAIATSTSGHSSVKDVLMDALPGASLDRLFKAGEALGSISREYTQARRIACLTETSKYPSRKNQKAVFRSYFQWEREARYAIWETVGRIGIMVHDGIDGIPKDLCDSAAHVLNDIGLRVD